MPFGTIIPQFNLGNSSLPDNSGQGFVPMNALAIANGYTYPQMPSRDSLGRYGITQEQQDSADRAAFSSVLGDVSQMFLGGSPAIGAGTGMRARQAGDAKLDAYSALNMKDFEAKRQAAAAEIDRISKLSDIERQQLVTQQEGVKLDQMKQMQQVAQAWVKSSEGIAEQYIGVAKAQDAELIKQGIMPFHEREMRSKLNVAAAAAIKGDMAGADAAFNEAIKGLPEIAQAKFKEDLVTNTANLAQSHKAAVEYAQQWNKDHAGSGMIADVNQDGKIVLKSQEDIAKEQLQLANLRQDIATKKALEDERRARANAGEALKPAQINKATQEVLNAAQTLKRIGIIAQQDSHTMLTGDKMKQDAERDKALSVINTYGLNASDPDAIIKLGQAGVRSAVQAASMQNFMLAGGNVIDPRAGGAEAGSNQMPGSQSYIWARKKIAEGVAGKRIADMPREEAIAILEDVKKMSGNDPVVSGIMKTFGDKKTANPNAALEFLYNQLNARYINPNTRPQG